MTKGLFIYSGKYSIAIQAQAYMLKALKLSHLSVV